MSQIDGQLAAALGIAQTVDRPRKSLDLSAMLKDRYHHRLTHQAIADKYGTSKQAVQQRLAAFEAKIGDPEVLQSYQDLEDRIQTAIKLRYSSHLVDADLSKLGAKDAAIVYSIIYDKHRLQTNQSTSNQSVFFHIVDEAGDQAPQDVVPDAIVTDPPE